VVACYCLALIYMLILFRLGDSAGGLMCKHNHSINARLADLLAAAAAASPRLGGEVLPQLLQERSYSAQQLLDALNRMYPDDIYDPVKPDRSGVVDYDASNRFETVRAVPSNEGHGDGRGDETSSPAAQAGEPTPPAGCPQGDGDNPASAAVPAARDTSGEGQRAPTPAGCTHHAGAAAAIVVTEPGVHACPALHVDPRAQAAVLPNHAPAALAEPQDPAIAPPPDPTLAAEPWRAHEEYVDPAFDNRAAAVLPADQSNPAADKVAEPARPAPAVEPVPGPASSFTGKKSIRTLGIWGLVGLAFSAGAVLLSRSPEAQQRALAWLGPVFVPKVSVSWSEWYPAERNCEAFDTGNCTSAALVTSTGGSLPDPVPSWANCKTFDTVNCTSAALVQALVISTDANKGLAAEAVSRCARNHRYSGTVASRFPVAIDFLTRQLRRDSVTDNATTEALLSMLPGTGNKLNVAEALSHLARMLLDGEAEVKAVAVQALAGVGGGHPTLTAELGVVTPLVQLLQNETDDVKEAALMVTSNLIVGNETNKKTFEDAGAIPALVQLLDEGGDSVQAAVAGVVGKFASGSDNYQEKLSSEGVLQQLPRLLEEEGADAVKKQAALALAEFASFPECQAAIPFARQLLSAESAASDKVIAARVLDSLAKHVINKRVIVATGAVSLLMREAIDVNSTARLHARATLKSLITVLPDEESIAAPDAIPAMVHMLTTGPDNRTRAVANVLREFTLDAGVRKLMADAGIVPAAVAAVEGSTPDTVVAVLSVLQEMALDTENSAEFVRAEAIAVLRSKLVDPTPGIKVAAAKVLWNLAARAKTYNDKLLAGAQTIPLLVDMLAGSASELQSGAGALASLARFSENRQLIVTEGTLPFLKRALLSNLDARTGEICVGLTNNLAIDTELATRIVERDFLPLLVPKLLTGSHNAKKWGAWALRNIARAPEHRAVIVKAGAVETLQKLRDGGNDELKAEAGRVLKLLGK
jgi:hypothetical protein